MAALSEADRDLLKREINKYEFAKTDKEREDVFERLSRMASNLSFKANSFRDDYIKFVDSLPLYLQNELKKEPNQFYDNWLDGGRPNDLQEAEKMGLLQLNVNKYEIPVTNTSSGTFNYPISNDLARKEVDKFFSSQDAESVKKRDMFDLVFDGSGYLRYLPKGVSKRGVVKSTKDFDEIKKTIESGGDISKLKADRYELPVSYERTLLETYPRNAHPYKFDNDKQTFRTPIDTFETYDTWIKENNLTGAKTQNEKEAVRKAYVEKVLIPAYGSDREGFAQAIEEFDKNRPLPKDYLAEITPPTISPSLPVQNQVVPSSLGLPSGGVKAATTGANATSQIDNVLERIRNLRTQSAADKAIADVSKSKAATAMTLGAGALKGLTGLGQYLGGRKELRGLEMPKEPVYQPNQAIDTELARLQVLAQSGDPLIREQAMRDIATRQAIAEQAYRVGSGGDVSAFGAGVAGANIAGMNAARQLAADVNQMKMQYGSQLAGLIGQQTQDRQFKQQADYNNFLAAVKEYERKGDRAAGQMDAGISNIATGVQDLRLAGVERIGSKAAMDKLLSDFKAMTPEMQKQMIAKYPKLFGQFAETKNSANTQGMRVLPIGLAATGFPIPIKSTNFSVK